MAFNKLKDKIFPLLVAEQVLDVDSLDDYLQLQQVFKDTLLLSNPTVMAYVMVSMMSEMINLVEKSNQVQQHIVKSFSLCETFIEDNNLSDKLSEESRNQLQSAVSHFKMIQQR